MTDDPELPRVEELFLRHAPALPGGMAAAVFTHAVETGEATEDLPQRLADLVDLLWMQYDDEADPLRREDWVVLRDLVDENAAELDLPLVQYIMERVVSHHAIDEQ